MELTDEFYVNGESYDGHELAERTYILKKLLKYICI